MPAAPPGQVIMALAELALEHEPPPPADPYAQAAAQVARHDAYLAGQG